MKSAEMRSKILGMPAHPQIFVDHPLASKTEAEVIAMAEAAVDFFIAAYGVQYDKAVERLVKDRERLLTFYNFPAEHWNHIRTSNPIESTFATVRQRTVKTCGNEP